MNRSRFIKWGVLLCLLSLIVVSAAYAQTTYVIQPGDTLSSIAAQFNTTVAAIAAANNIVNPNWIFAGDTLIIPGDGPPPTDPQPPPTDPTPPAAGGTYTVQLGDTLSTIAVRFNTTVAAIAFNTTVAAIAQLNGIANPNYIYAGQVLTIPGGGGAPPAQPPPPTNPVPPPSSNSGFEVGGQTHSFANAGLMRDIGMRWVKFQHKWGPGDDPNGLAGRVADAHANGMKVLLSVTGANTYPAADSIDYGGFTEFLRGLASLGGNSPDAIEIWNEQNIDFEWPAGQIDPSSYVNNMLAPAHNAWADDRYVNGMAAAGAASYADCIGVHHNAGATSPTVSSGHPGGSHYSWYYQPTVNVYSGAFGGSRPLCFTELGYLSTEDFGAIPANFAWASGTSVAEHAQWLAEAVSLSNQQGRVRMLIVFNVDFDYFDPTGDPQAGYAMIRPGGGCPACNTLSSVIPR